MRISRETRNRLLIFSPTVKPKSEIFAVKVIVVALSLSGTRKNIRRLDITVHFTARVHMRQTFGGAMEKPGWWRRVRMDRSGQGQPRDVLR